jgi:hypothetical protein
MQLLLERINRADPGGSSSYRPLPYLDWQHKLDGLATSPRYRDLLRQIRDRALQQPEATFWLAHLYKEVSLDFSADGLAVLDEWIDTGDKKKIEAACDLLKEAPADLIFTNFAFVEHLIDKAYAMGDATYRRACSQISYKALHDTRVSIPGQPAPKDVSLRDKAQSAASSYPIGSPIRRFYEDLAKYTQSNMQWDIALDEDD